VHTNFVREKSAGSDFGPNFPGRLARDNRRGRHPATLGRDWLYRLWSRWFRLSPQQFDMINLAGMTFYKTGILLFNIVPCISLYLVR
jgi:hypothetical protein